MLQCTVAHFYMPCLSENVFHYDGYIVSKEKLTSMLLTYSSMRNDVLTRLLPDTFNTFN